MLVVPVRLVIVGGSTVTVSAPTPNQPLQVPGGLAGCRIHLKSKKFAKSVFQALNKCVNRGDKYCNISDEFV